MPPRQLIARLSDLQIKSNSVKIGQALKGSVNFKRLVNTKANYVLTFNILNNNKSLTGYFYLKNTLDSSGKINFTFDIPLERRETSPMFIQLSALSGSRTDITSPPNVSNTLPMLLEVLPK